MCFRRRTWTEVRYKINQVREEIKIKCIVYKRNYVIYYQVNFTPDIKIFPSNILYLSFLNKRFFETFKKFKIT